jgi:uncharacterized membrane protein YhaH (DUF805 family)
MEHLFSAQGRVARLELLVGYLWLGFFVGSIGFVGVASIIQGGAGSTFGPIWVVVAIVLLSWGGIVLTIKRLHDIGLSGVHSIWMWLINIAAGALAVISPVLSILFSLATLGVTLWLFFAPSQPSANEYGPPHAPKPNSN